MSDANTGDRALETARALRAAAEEARRTILASREIVQRSQEQTRAMINRPEIEPCDHHTNQPPSEKLVRCLIQAYELAIDEDDVQTQALLGSMLHDVGGRIAAAVGPKAAQMILH
ncbi:MULTISPECIES: hypothetical protein [unclassified Methylobacterium]|uniref:hypothetical protein n=1 Tax=unclassified Methylobacterium TaxID=2615210 RepID=UPI00037B01B5|nr:MULTISPECIES: hypothetical protein [unclassified Methylobacterium]KQP45165.1 hypothetical protein ASF34_21435 [Methylobacterium sp. Leaf106]TXN33024.1 hypothetical protein FV220_04255 [Methylobacterium sp. WL19]